MLIHILCLFLYNFSLLGSDSSENHFALVAAMQIGMDSVSRPSVNQAVEARKAVAQKKYFVAIYRAQEETLIKYQQNRQLSELAKAKVNAGETIDLPTIKVMKLRIESNQKSADDKIIEEALDILGFEFGVRPSWKEIEATYLRLNTDPNTYQSPVALDKAFLVLRELKDKISSFKISNYTVFEVDE